MDKICTSIEQSQKLIELGIDINTADMSWLSWMKDGKPRIGFNSELFNNLYDISDFRHEYMPAWSLPALLELMPPYLFEFERGIDLTIYPNLNGKCWHCSYMPNTIENMKNDKFRQITNGNDPVDAAFEMVCWLLENELEKN